MKNRNLFLGLIVFFLGFISCKDNKETDAQKSVDAYVVYVDSLGGIATEDAKTNWETIDADYQFRFGNAETALENIKDKEAAQARIDASKAKYDMLKSKLEAEREEVVPIVSSKQKMRNALFGEGKIGDDMNFSWVNAGNIHDVYQQFVHTVENNKDTYSREDWDEIKTMYEALDSRKNTVEKEGLSAEDNTKIAGLKMKFAPMYRLNRMGAKSEEMEKAKE